MNELRAVECTGLSASPSSQESRLGGSRGCTCVSASARQSRAQCRAREFGCKILFSVGPFLVFLVFPRVLVSEYSTGVVCVVDVVVSYQEFSLAHTGERLYWLEEVKNM